MQLHRNAKLGPAGRRRLVGEIEQGATLRQAAGRCGVSVATAHRWQRRWSAADAAERASWSCLADRSSRPRRMPRMLPADTQARICQARRQRGWGPRLIAGQVGIAHSTVSATLHRHGLSRAPKATRPVANRYEWPCPGDLLHMDIKRYARFGRPGHARTGIRGHTKQERRQHPGYVYAHAIVDDHTRLAYSELLSDQRAATVTAFTERALNWFASHRISARRVLTDNAWNYTHNRSLAALFSAHRIGHRTTRPYRPRTNGKVERFHQTMSREWGYGLTYPTSQARDAALPHWLQHYNTDRPHSALNGHPPMTRVHNLSGHDN